ncbi:MAG: hypothetical protein NTW90_02985 [Nitrosospira sp.]|nr:hypothetical protein [Nitrosospira sp.]
MMLIYLNLVIIVFLGFYVSITQRNGKSVRPGKKHPQGRFDLNKIPGQLVTQGHAAWVDPIMVDATFVEVSRLHSSQERGTQTKTGVTPTARQEKSTQSKFHPKDVDACWIKKRRESHHYSGPFSQDNNTSSIRG